jgi:DNA-binding transcriptional ArsR family regulator
MDSLLTAASIALAGGDPLGALKRVALREDPPALALRGIAMAQLGDLARAKALLRRAAREFGSREPLARARCTTAEAEIALASRDLAWPKSALAAAVQTLEAHGDHANVMHARTLRVRRHLLLGEVDEAESALASTDFTGVPPMLVAVHQLLSAEVAMRRLRSGAARAALVAATEAAERARIPSLVREVDNVKRNLDAPAARAITGGVERTLLLEEVEAILTSGALVIDACRHVVLDGEQAVPLARRPVLFALVRALGEAWPGDAARDVLASRAFGARLLDDSHRARLRVEMARLRRALADLAELQATKRGFSLVPRRAKEIVVLALPVEDEHARVLALLGDGESWSSSALALALGLSQRTVQRSLSALEKAGKVRSHGRARAQRWMAPPITRFATALLLPAPVVMG